MRFTIRDWLWLVALAALAGVTINQQYQLDELSGRDTEAFKEIDRVEARVNHVREDHNNLAEDFEIRVIQRPRGCR